MDEVCSENNSKTRETVNAAVKKNPANGAGCCNSNLKKSRAVNMGSRKKVQQPL